MISQRLWLGLETVWITLCLEVRFAITHSKLFFSSLSSHFNIGGVSILLASNDVASTIFSLMTLFGMFTQRS